MIKTIFIIAGETSGDLIGANLIKAIKQINSNINFIGIGGHNMVKQGLEPLFQLNEISVIGIVEVLSKLPQIVSRLFKTVRKIEHIRPDALITIDFSGFNHRIARILKRRNNEIPIIHYVAPPVWAWRPWRAKKMPKFIDLLLTLFAFEPPLFEKHGLKTHFIGHPTTEDINLRPPTPDEITQFCNKYNITLSDPLICVLPGSRQSEITKHTQIFLGAVSLLRQDVPNLQAYVPTLIETDCYVSEITKEYGGITSADPRDKGIAMALSSCALAASGTVSLELAISKTPTVVAYKTNALTACMVRKLIKIPHISLVNMLLGEEIIPELLQNQCTPQLLYTNLLALIKNQSLRDRQIKAFKEVSNLIKSTTPQFPSQNAANIIINFLTELESRQRI